MDTGCLAFSNCAWYEYLVFYSIAGAFLGYIIGSAVLTAILIMAVIRS